MAGTKYDISIEQGACFSLAVALTDENDLAYDLVDGSPPYLTGSIYRDYDQKIQAVFNYNEVDAANGIAEMTLTSEQTKAIEPAYSSYDIFLVKDDGCINKLLYGAANISGTATLLP